MGEVVNLRTVRKRKARAAAAEGAAENRVRFGRSLGEKRREAEAQVRQTRHLDGHRLQDRPDEPA